MFFEKFELGIKREAVDCNVDFTTPCVGVIDPLFKALHIELFSRTDTQREVAYTAIDGISAVVDSDFEFFKISRRGEEFDCFQMRGARSMLNFKEF